jgi:toxin-antitoxin system PIN domain toxin
MTSWQFGGEAVRMPDVNILIYAHRADEAVHEPYKAWLEQALAGAEPLALSVLSAVGFVRIVTNARVYSAPTPLGTALAAIEAIAAHPNCRVVGTDASHLTRFVEISRASKVAGKHVADAQHAAVAIASAATWVTRDADFRRFESVGLRWQHLVLG